MTGLLYRTSQCNWLVSYSMPISLADWQSQSINYNQIKNDWLSNLINQQVNRRQLTKQSIYHQVNWRRLTKQSINHQVRRLTEKSINHQVNRRQLTEKSINHRVSRRWPTMKSINYQVSWRQPTNQSINYWVSWRWLTNIWSIFGSCEDDIPGHRNHTPEWPPVHWHPCTTGLLVHLFTESWRLVLLRTLQSFVQGCERVHTGGRVTA